MTERQLAEVAADARSAATLGRPFPVYRPLRPFHERVAARVAGIEEETLRPVTDAEERQIRGRRRAGNAPPSPATTWCSRPSSPPRCCGHSTRASTCAAPSATPTNTPRTPRWPCSNGTPRSPAPVPAAIAQIDTHGLIAAAFDHYDSRDGDPNLHTHVAIANKVQGVDGRWRALDARALYRITVAASEHYNTTFQTALTAALGVTWTAQTDHRRAGTGVRDRRHPAVGSSSTSPDAAPRSPPATTNCCGSTAPTTATTRPPPTATSWPGRQTSTPATARIHPAPCRRCAPTGPANSSTPSDPMRSPTSSAPCPITRPPPHTSRTSTRSPIGKAARRL